MTKENEVTQTSQPSASPKVDDKGLQGGMELVHQQLLAGSYREYGNLSLQERNAREQLDKIQRRMEEVRQHIATLETAQNIYKDRQEQLAKASSEPH